MGRTRRNQFLYWPLAMPFLLGGLVAVLMLTVLLQLGSFTLARLGISPAVAMLLLIASLIGSAINVPLARLGTHDVTTSTVVRVFGVRYLIPVTTRRYTTVAVNVGGALIPVGLSAYLIAHDHLGLLALGAIAIVTYLVHLVARPVPGLGIAVPALLPGVFAALTALVLSTTSGHPYAIAGLAYTGGTLGTLIGADLTNLGKVGRLGAPMASIGGAGTFDGVFMAGLLAVLLASLI